MAAVGKGPSLLTPSWSDLARPGQKEERGRRRK